MNDPWVQIPSGNPVDAYIVAGLQAQGLALPKATVSTFSIHARPPVGHRAFSHLDLELDARFQYDQWTTQGVAGRFAHSAAAGRGSNVEKQNA
jgi:hypothetical protein